ncbi:MAG: sigma 54-interacting transcriptional regulator [Candidatus Acidiferrales bacterium]
MASSRPESELLNIQLLVDSIPALIHTARPDGYLDYFNRPWLEYLGVTLDKVAGWNWTTVIHPEELDGIVAAWRAALATGEIFEYETRVRRADGEYRWMLHRKVPLRCERGNIVKWYGSSMDIEERKRAEQAWQRNEFYLAEGQRLGHMGSWAFNPDGFDYWSPELFRMYGLDPAGKPPSVREYLGFIHPQDHESMAHLINRLVAEDTPFDATKRIVRPDGEVRYIRCVGAPVVESQSVKKYVGSAIDVTEHELLTQELRRREAYLTEAQRLSQTGSFGWKVPSGELSWSDETFRIFGYDRSVKPTTDSVMQRVHPEDRADVKEVLNRAFAGAPEFEHAYRLVLPDGQLKHVHAIAHVLQDTSGNREFVGAATDITERHHAEAVIREQEAEVRQILDLAPQIIAVYGPHRQRLYANRVMLDYIGVSLEDWRRSASHNGVHPDDYDRIDVLFDRAVARASTEELELRLRKRDGSYRWFLARFNPLRDEDGQITRWYVTGTDIEDRKQTEQRLQRENVALREEIDSASMFEEIVGSSPALRTVLSRISKVGPTDSTVLLTGETGTGKELIARALHKRSSRSSRAFVSVNCAAIPPALIAPELFGHEKGAFTGALQRRLGRFELAEGGTIFLDEVGELPMETQVALLRVLQEREFERVGGNQAIRADVRVIAATNRDLDAAIAAGAFRKDLFYRLNVFPIEIPPLRDRKEDIPMLVEYFIHRYARKSGKKMRTIEKKSLELLRSYAWPGNIRELQNIVERSLIVCESETFSVDESWLSFESSGAEQSSSQPLAKKPAAQEAEIIEAALAKSCGRVSGGTGAAMLLGMPASTLESKIRSLKINKFRFKNHSTKNN